MQYDVLASLPLTGNGQLENQAGESLARIRIKAIYGIAGATAGTISFYNGTANSDPSIILLPVPAAANQGAFFLLIPGEGILAQDGVYVEIGTAASVIVIYG
jgi:hypothetical protein